MLNTSKMSTHLRELLKYRTSCKLQPPSSGQWSPTQLNPDRTLCCNEGHEWKSCGCAGGGWVAESGVKATGSARPYAPPPRPRTPIKEDRTVAASRRWNLDAPILTLGQW